MTLSQHFELLLEPDQQRPLYHGTGGMYKVKQPSLLERMKEMEKAFPDYQRREEEYKEYLKTKSEYR